MDQLRMEKSERLLHIASTNQEVQSLIEENNALLDSLTCFMKPYKLEIKGKPTVQCYAIEGEIHANGYLYCDTLNQRRMTFSYENYRSLFFSFYPTKLTGNIDFLGNLKLRVTEIKYCYFGAQTPVSFQCTFNSNSVTANIDKTEWTLNTQEFISKLILDPFGGDSFKREKFVKNRSELLTYLKK
jgi:hypothetical protein